MNKSGYVGYISFERPSYYSSTIAKIFGLTAAIYLQELAFLLNPDHNKNKHDGKYWVYNTYEQWANRLGRSPKTIQRTVAGLVKRRIIIVAKNPRLAWDRKNWYTINYYELDQQIAAFQESQGDAKPRNISSDFFNHMEQVNQPQCNRSKSPDPSRHFDPCNNNNIANKHTTTTTSACTAQQGGISVGSRGGTVENEINAVLQFSAEDSVDCSLIASATLGQVGNAEVNVEAVIDMVCRCGLTQTAATNLVREFGVDPCRQAALDMDKNLKNGIKIEHSTHNYFRAIARTKLLESQSEMSDDVRTTRRERIAVRTRKKSLETLRWESLSTDSGEAAQALAHLRRIADGDEVGWSDDDRAVAAAALDCPTLQERQAITRRYLGPLKQKLLNRP